MMQHPACLLRFIRISDDHDGAVQLQRVNAEPAA